MTTQRAHLEHFLNSCGRDEFLQALSSEWLDAVLPGISGLKECVQDNANHSEGDVAVHTALVFETLIDVCRQDLGREADFIERLAAMMHDWKKPIARAVNSVHTINFPRHEELAAAEVPVIGDKLELTDRERTKLFYLVAQHGNAHSFATLSERKRREILQSPYLDSLRALQKADAMSCHLPGGGHLPVRWHELCPEE